MTLCISQLAFERNNEPLFHPIDCTVSTSEILQVRGANGCGKSTLLRIFAGYISPEMGTIFWQGKNIFQQRDEYIQQLCYIGHQNGIKLHLTVSENLKLICALANQKIPHSSFKKILHTMQLENIEHTQAIHLSAGQKRRLALARLLLMNTRLWILDEPMTSLDQAGQTLIADLLNQHIAQGGMAVVATHHDLKMTGKMLYLPDANYSVMPACF